MTTMITPNGTTSFTAVPENHRVTESGLQAHARPR
jgi:hypothetical protein